MATLEAIFFFLFRCSFENDMNIFSLTDIFGGLEVFVGYLMPPPVTCLFFLPFIGMCLYLILFIVVKPSKNISVRGDAGGSLFFSVSMLF